MPWLLIGLAALWYFEIWPFGPSYTYRAEVGYYSGLKHEWFVGSDRRTHEECAEEAIWRFNSMNRESPGRAFSWACRKMRGESFEGRVR